MYICNDSVMHELGLVDVHGSEIIASIQDTWNSRVEKPCRLRLETVDCSDILSSLWLRQVAPDRMCWL